MKNVKQTPVSKVKTTVTNFQAYELGKKQQKQLKGGFVGEMDDVLP